MGLFVFVNRGLRTSRSCGALALMLFVCAGVLGCDGSKVSNAVGSSPPLPPPFDTKLGEGTLADSTVVQVYPTSADTGLDGFYQQIACPPNADSNICNTNTASLNTSQFGNFDLSTNPIANNAAGVQKVDAIKVHYTAINVDGTADTVSGGIAMPELPASAIRGLILYFHGTTTDRTKVPSNFVPLSNSSSYTDGTLLAAVWASQGYVVAMPDYIGLGDDTSHPHPYVVYPQQNAQSGLAMVKAARALLSKNYGLSGTLPFFTTGYSEGGAYALEAGKLMQLNSAYASTLQVTLRKVVPLSGFFDLSTTGLSYLFANIQAQGPPYYVYDVTDSELSKPYLMAYLVSSYAHYAGALPSDIFAAPFDPPCSPECDTLYNLYFTSNSGDDYVIAKSDEYASDAGYLGQQGSSAQPLLTAAYAAALMNHDITNPLFQQIASADTYLFTPQFPVTVLSLEQDSIVTRANSDIAFSYFTLKNPAGPYQKVLIPNASFETPGYVYGYYEIDHTTELAFMSVLMLNQFNLGSQQGL